MIFNSINSPRTRTWTISITDISSKFALTKVCLFRSLLSDIIVIRKLIELNLYGTETIVANRIRDKKQTHFDKLIVDQV